MIGVTRKKNELYVAILPVIKNVATLALILCRQVKTIKHGSVRINIVQISYTLFS